MVLAEEMIFFNQHQQKLARAYPGCFLVIKEQRVYGGFPSIREAYSSALEKFEIGTFLVIKTLPVVHQTLKPQIRVRPSFLGWLLLIFMGQKHPTV